MDYHGLIEILVYDGYYVSDQSFEDVLIILIIIETQVNHYHDYIHFRTIRPTDRMWKYS